MFATLLGKLTKEQVLAQRVRDAERRAKQADKDLRQARIAWRLHLHKRELKGEVE